MRTQSIYPTEYPLPRLRDNADRHRAPFDGLQVSAAQVAAFDELLHEIHPDAERVDAERLAHLAGWLLSLPETEARSVLGERLSRIEELRAMVEDPDWDCADPDCARVRALLRYLDQPDDLIPDTIPLLGKLDDMLLLELAWPAIAEEAEEYRDFVMYREATQPAGDGARRRAAWISNRLGEMAMLRLRLRANDGLHLNDGRRVLHFRIV